MVLRTTQSRSTNSSLRPPSGRFLIVLVTFIMTLGACVTSEGLETTTVPTEPAETSTTSAPVTTTTTADQADPAAVLADYLEVWNAEDAEAVMVFYAEDAVIEGHPEDTGDVSTGKSEIFPIEDRMDGYQGSTGTMEFINIEVSGDTVTYDNIFHNGSGGCFSSSGTVVTVEGDKIARMVWGDTDADLC